MKLNFGDVGYYRVEYDAATRAALANSIKQMAPADRINLLSDTWAMVEAGRVPPAAFFGLVDHLAGEESRAVWQQVDRGLLADRPFGVGQAGPGRHSSAYARAVLRPVFDRAGWDAAASEATDRTQLRARLVRTLGVFGDEAILTEARRRFALFVKDPAALPADLRDPVTYLAGRTADRTTYDTLIGLGRKTTNTEERVRYYSAAASALDPALAQETLAIALTEELPSSLVGTLISWVAQGEHPDLAWTFVRENFSALVAKAGTLVPYILRLEPDDELHRRGACRRARELRAGVRKRPADAMVAARAHERMMTDADFSAQQLPAIEEWIRSHGAPR